MKVKILDFGYKYTPYRSHYDDAGADVFILEDVEVKRGATKAIPLGFGLEIPNGYVGFIMPRSSYSKCGLVTELSPIDSGYRGEIHAIVHNQWKGDMLLKAGDRVGQLVIFPVIIANFMKGESGKKRDKNAFGSTGN